MIVIYEQFGVKIHDTSLARKTIIEEDAILGRTGKATYIDFPVRVPKRIRLLDVNSEILIKIEYHNIRRTA